MSANIDDSNHPFCGACMTNHPRGGVCTSRLEEVVIEAAIACKYAATRDNEPLSKYGFSVDLERAVCALITAREKE